MSVKVAINGAAGRMGRRLVALAVEDAGLELVQALEFEGHPHIGKSIAELIPESGNGMAFSDKLTGETEVMVDFSLPEGTVARIPEAVEKGVALIIGTTGLNETQEAIVAEASRKVPVIHAPNYSLGVNLVFRVAAEVAKALGEDFDVEITESHHNKKADAPSGTALGIAKHICEAIGRDVKKDLVHGRAGQTGARTKREIGMHALRLGSVVGDHTVHFGSEFERIELTHRAQTRDVFAAGALRAAKWIVGRKSGMYSMADVLFG